MRYVTLLLSVITLTACDSDPAPNHFQVSPAISVQTLTMTAVTQQGNVYAFGVLEAAQEINLNVEFSAPVESVLVDEGQTVIRDQPLLILDTSKLALSFKQTQHMLAQAKTQQDNAHLNYSRLQTLAKSNTVSRQHYDDARFARDAANAKVRELKTQLQLIERDLNNRTVLSPIDAVVDRRHVEAGQSITAYQPLLTLQAVKSVKVSVFVGEHHLPHLQVGNRGWVNTVAGTFESDIYSISATSAPQTGNFEIKLLLDNSNNRVKPGMTADVTLLSTPVPDQLIIPESALIAWQGQHVVYVVQNGKAHRQPVEVALGFDDQLAISTGLSIGDQVIVAGADQVTQGSVLEINNE